MKAVRIVEIGSPLADAQIETPHPGRGEVLVRVRAAGICHSDVHYRAGVSPVGTVPITPGHEIAGTVEAVGAGFSAGLVAGDRVCVHYLATCGRCRFCAGGNEQFCETGQMIGKHRDGGYAEFACVPSSSIHSLPENVPFDIAAVLMCSVSTSMHALRRAGFRKGESLAIFGFGGLGFSALRLAQAMGAKQVVVVDTNHEKLRIAAANGADTVDGATPAAFDQVVDATNGVGVDVALDFVGKPITSQAAVRALATQGRAAIVGIGSAPFQVNGYDELINKEATVIGVSDHLSSEIDELLALTAAGTLNLDGLVSGTVTLDAHEINEILDMLEAGSDGFRYVIELP